MSVAATRVLAWRGSTFAIALVGSLLMWAALPPLALGWLGWIAPVPWLLLVRRNELPGRRPYRTLYLAGLIFWLLAIHWLRLPHPLVHLGWLALAAYLAVYLPVFVALSRTAVHRLRVPLWIAAPVVWTGLELARAHLLTGFLMGSLAHTQVNWTAIIQISDLVGEYGVDFVIVLVAACIASALPGSEAEVETTSTITQSRLVDEKRRFHAMALLPGVVVFAATLIYGHVRLAQHENTRSKIPAIGPRLAIIQGNSLAEWKADTAREGQIMDEYLSLSRRAVDTAKQSPGGRPVDLVIWPETMFRTPMITFDPGYQLPPGESRTPDTIAAYGPHDLAAVVSRLQTPVLVGVDRVHYPLNGSGKAESPPRIYNSAVLVGPDGKVVASYDKIHLVMFGEYIPFASWIPFLYRLTPLTGGIESGAEPAAMWLNATYCFCPNICYETAIPHVIRRQVATLESRSEYPDALVNLTNDAWYWGSSELDMHLACGVFRAVETRVPLVIAANGGISAHIDRLGRIQAELPRQQSDFLLADIEPGHMRSWYMDLGDWFAGLCLACCAVLAFVGWRARKSDRIERTSPV